LLNCCSLLPSIRESNATPVENPLSYSDRREQLALGWSYDESFDVMIPPGYVQGPDYRPKPPELPVNYYSKYRGARG
jgi:hypothetical protein